MTTRVPQLDVPLWLAVMRAITGLTEGSGDADNPKILGMRDFIAHKFPEQSDYCALYQHDETPWCGLCAAFCMAVGNISGPFGETDVERWMWALSWADNPNYVKLDAPVPGAVIVTQREGGGHVTFYERTEGSSYVCRGGNQSNAVNEANIPVSSVVAIVWPASVETPPIPRRDLQKGDTGSDVVAVQQLLGLPADGEFGSTTETAVMGFQKAVELTADGAVGQNTWDALDELELRLERGHDGLPDKLIEQVANLAYASSIDAYEWPGRGVAPDGYIAAMACCFALALMRLDIDQPVARNMACIPDPADEDTDALAWLHDEFKALDMENNTPSETLRHLFVLLIGLGMRESSGVYCVGRDQTASNTASDTCEAGLFQTSWNIHTAHDDIELLFDEHWSDPNGFFELFADGIVPKASDLQNWGTGLPGLQYQWLAKRCPAFAVMSTAIGLRYRRQHWGPINRKEVTLRREADELLWHVQKLVREGPPIVAPDDEPDDDMPVVTITIDADRPVRIVTRGAVEEDKR